MESKILLSVSFNDLVSTDFQFSAWVVEFRIFRSRVNLQKYELIILQKEESKAKWEQKVKQVQDAFGGSSTTTILLQSSHRKAKKDAYTHGDSSVNNTHLNHDHFQEKDHRIKCKTDKDWVVLWKHVFRHFSDIFLI